MGLSWHAIMHKENEVAKATVNAGIDAHTDPKIQIAMELQDLQDRHNRLVASSAQVIANNSQTEMRLNRALAQQAELDADIKAAMANGHTDSAKTFAIQLATVEKQVEHLKAEHEQTSANAAEAQQAIQDNADEMQAKIAESNELRMEVDQAAMQTAMADNMEQVHAIAGTDVPSFDDIRNKVEGQLALSQAKMTTAQANPEVAMMHAHHEAIEDQADAILARYQPATSDSGK